MVDQCDDFTAEKIVGMHKVRTLYLDNREEVKRNLKPNVGHPRSILGYLTIFAPMKFENNETACGICFTEDKKWSNQADCRKFLGTIDPLLNSMMTDEAIKLFMD